MTDFRTRSTAGRLEHPGTAVDARRRLVCGLPLAAGAAAWAGLSAAAESGGTTRMALVIGNRQYPAPHDLPPVHKNVRDLREALELRGFEVSSAVDLAPDALRAAIAPARGVRAHDATAAWSEAAALVHVDFEVAWRRIRGVDGVAAGVPPFAIAPDDAFEARDP